jgi:3-phosphoinositide dependent protein kinase-1
LNEDEDFFNCKTDEHDPESKGSFVGTEDYVAPEIVKNQEATFSSDLWSLGIIIYLAFAGKTPFKGHSPFYTFENILACNYTIPDSIPEDAKDLITKLLKVNPKERLGAGNSEEEKDNNLDSLKKHPFFKDINFT